MKCGYCGNDFAESQHHYCPEGQRFLLAELARLRAANVELERKINDIAGDAARNLVDATAQDDENKLLRAVNAELVEALKVGLELMPLGTAKRADWLVKAGNIISESRSDMEKRYENRGHLMDAYVLALAEIADGRESPVEFARTVLRQDAKTLIESAKARERAEQAGKAEWSGK